MAPWIVEHWNHFARKRQDLFGVWDILAIGNGETWAVQTTSTGVSERIKKIEASEYYDRFFDAGWRCFVHGWRKNSKGIYVMREIELTSENLLSSIDLVGSDAPACGQE